LLLSLLGAVLLLLIAVADLLLAPAPLAGRPLAFTVRVPTVGVFRDTMSGGTTFDQARTVYPRGTIPSAEALRLIRAFEDRRRPPAPPLLVGFGLLFTLLIWGFSTVLRLEPGRARERRSLAALIGSLVLFAAAAKLFLILTPWSGFWLPLAGVVLAVTVQLGRGPALAMAALGALVLSLMAPLDGRLLLVMLGQGVGAAVAAGAGSPRARLSRGTAGAVVGSVLLHLAATLVFGQPAAAGSPSLLASLGAAAGGAALGGILALALQPLLGAALGGLSRGRLVELSNLDAPLLKNLATRAPGTWAHSLTVANMAEIAANAIGADALLVRVGAYYHDLGKANHPHYFIENQTGDNPHDRMEPNVSADAIIAHVVDGVKLARRHKIPEELNQFIYTHHGNGLLEYFWHRALERGNPKDLSERDFVYPGSPPRSREASILAICDSVEAASRTLDNPGPERIRKLVRQIVFGKVESGLLSGSPLSMHDLQRVMDSLVEFLKSAHHGRVKYPWQEQPDEQEERLETGEVSPAPAAEAAPRTNGPPAQTGAPVAAPAASAPAEEGWPTEHGERERNRVRTQPLGVDVADDPKRPQ
jgi:hypothetical protein